MTTERNIIRYATSQRYLAFVCLALSFFLLSLPSRPALAQASAAPDARRSAEVAQVVLGIISYVRWPAPHPELRLCVAGNARHADALPDTAPSSLVPRIRIQRLAPGASIAPADCDVLYIGTLADAERDKLLQQIIGYPVLSISEPTASCSVGNMFCLRFRESQIAFDVNLDSIARSGLRVHPNALQIAKRKAQQP